MTEYSFISDDWRDIRDTAQLIYAESANRQLPIATETDAAFLFRDASGQIVHRYPFPGTGYNPILSHYLTYIRRDRPEWSIHKSTAKNMLLHQLFFVVMRLVGRCEQINILEIGSTIGENYYLLKQWLRQYNVPIEVHYVGIEVSADLCQFSRLVHAGDPRYIAIPADGSDLSRFPDRAFDVTLCNGVMNFVDNPELGFRELIRVTRRSSVFTYQVTEGNAPVRLIEGETGNRLYLPTKDSLSASWMDYAPLYDYTFTSIPMTQYSATAGGSGYYFGVNVADIKVAIECHTIFRDAPIESDE